MICYRFYVLWIFTPLYKDVPSFLILREHVLTRNLGSVRFVAIDDAAGLDPMIASLQRVPDVRVWPCPFNLGHQRAIVYGLRSFIDEWADDDAIVTMDGDGQDRADDVPRLLAALENASDGPAIVLAQRTQRREAPWFKLMYVVFKLVFRTLTGHVIRSGNFAAIRAGHLKKIIFHPSFDLCYSSTLTNLQIPTIAVGCARGERTAGESRMNVSKLILHGLRMMMPFLDRIAVRSALFFLALFVASSLSSLAIIGVRLFTHLAVPGWATYTLLMTLIISLVAFSQFVLLFTVFSQSQTVSLAGLDKNASTRTPPR